MKKYLVTWRVYGRKAFGPGYGGPEFRDHSKLCDNEAEALAWVKELKENQPVDDVQMVVEEDFL